MAKDAYYFSHDATARNDQKIIALRMARGMRGYGIYFGIIEMLREANAYHLPLNCSTIAYDLREPVEDVEDVVLNYGLFVLSEKGEYFYSESLLRRMESLDAIKIKRMEAGRIGGHAKAANAKQAPSKPLANAKQMPSSKVNTVNLVNESKTTTPSAKASGVAPTLEEVQTYFKENNVPLDAVSFFDHYDASNWFRGKTKIKNWKACITTWLKNKSNKKPQNFITSKEGKYDNV